MEKRSQLQLDRKIKDNWKAQSCAILDLLIVDPPSFKLWLFVCNKMTWGDRSKKHTHTRKIGQNNPNKSDQPFWDKAESGDYSSLKIGHLDEELFRSKWDAPH